MDVNATAEAAAERWLRSVLVDKNLGTVWPDTHPDFRLSLARKFLTRLYSDTSIYPEPPEDPPIDEISADLVQDEPTHSHAWPKFCQGQILIWRKAWPDFEAWAVDYTHPETLDTVVVAWVPASAPKIQGLVMPGKAIELRLVEQKWMVSGFREPVLRAQSPDAMS
jgi:hypothetical protein